LLAGMERMDRDKRPINELLKELNELRELDRRRHTHAPGSPDHVAVTTELDTRTRRLMDRFRDEPRPDRGADDEVASGRRARPH
jgi:hypothetical protein